ncbi:MAG: Na(+)/glucose symporter [Verrucomicrobiota bacterium]|jgi:SSS family solute:Na+ symporter
MLGAIGFGALDWVVLTVYFAGTLIFGGYFYLKTRTAEGYTAGNRSLPGWVCGLSIFATFLSSISYLANAGQTFMSNWSAFVFSLSIPLAVWVALRYFLPYYRREGHVSAYAALENRFGLWARLYASFFYILTQLARMAVVMYLMALPMQVIFGWEIRTVLLVVGVTVTVYSFMGGILAVIWTDAIQAVVLMGGAILVLLIIVFQTPGFVPEMWEVGMSQGKFSFGGMGFDLAEKTFWTLLLFGIAENLRNFGIDQSYVQRYVAARDDGEARKSLWVVGILYVPMSAIFFFIGTALFVYYNADEVANEAPASAVWESESLRSLHEVRKVVARQELLQGGMERGAEGFDAAAEELARTKGIADLGDRVFPYFIATQLPAGITGLLVAAIFAAGMSTVSTSLNSSATLLMTDYYRRLINPAGGERAEMRVLYGGTVLWGVLGTLLALVLVEVTQSALDIWWTFSGIFSGGMAGLFLLGLISRRANNPIAVTSVLLGLAVILWMSLPKVGEILVRADAEGALFAVGQTILLLSNGGLASPFHALMIPVVGLLVILLSGLFLTRVFQK